MTQASANIGHDGRPVPFVDYYRDNDISPVAQNIDDLARHYGRRESLYRLLGIAPASLRDRAVLELCPGSGHNALYTQSLAPARYVLVDGNPVGFARMRDLFAERRPDARNLEFHLSLVENFVSDARFDFVFCEGVIPFQYDPRAFARALDRFVAPGGTLVVTCMDAVSHLGEATRRLLGARHAPRALPLAERLRVLRPIIAPHFASLAGASRCLDDWILDNVTFPVEGAFFSLRDAVEALGPLGYDVYGSSPNFTVDWRWYKDIVPGAQDWNARFLDAFAANTLNFIDYREVFAPRSPAFGARVERACATLWEAILDADRGVAGADARAVELLEALARDLAEAAPRTARSLAELGAHLRGPLEAEPRFDAFTSFFGRGMQYASFLKNPEATR